MAKKHSHKAVPTSSPPTVEGRKYIRQMADNLRQVRETPGVWHVIWKWDRCHSSTPTVTKVRLKEKYPADCEGMRLTTRTYGGGYKGGTLYALYGEPREGDCNEPASTRGQ